MRYSIMITNPILRYQDHSSDHDGLNSGFILVIIIRLIHSRCLVLLVRLQVGGCHRWTWLLLASRQSNLKQNLHQIQFTRCGFQWVSRLAFIYPSHFTSVNQEYGRESRNLFVSILPSKGHMTLWYSCIFFSTNSWNTDSGPSCMLLNGSSS